MSNTERFFASQGWTEVTPESFPVFRKYYEADESILQQRSATSLIAWTAPGMGLWKIIEGWLCSIYFTADKSPAFVLYGLPENRAAFPAVIDKLYNLNELYYLNQASGTDDAGALPVVFNDERHLGLFKGLDATPDATPDASSTGYSVEISTLEKTAEYLYLIDDIRRLDGKENRHRRHAVNIVEAMGKVEIVRGERQDFGKVLGLENEWCQRQNCVQCASYYGCERSAIARMLEIFDPAIHNCFFARINNEIRGFLICEKKLNTVMMFFGKGLAPNLLPYLVYRVSVDYFADCKWMNYAEDMGDPGLHTAKERFGPHTMLHRYQCKIRKKQ